MYFINIKEIPVGVSTAVNQLMLDTGWIEYTGSIPTKTTEFGYFGWDGTSIIEVIDYDRAKRDISNKVSELLDTKAKSLRYDNIMSARSYAGFVNPFQAEALQLATWAADCWAVIGQIEQDIANQVIPMPVSADAVIAQLPVCPL